MFMQVTGDVGKHPAGSAGIDPPFDATAGPAPGAGCGAAGLPICELLMLTLLSNTPPTKAPVFVCIRHLDEMAVRGAGPRRGPLAGPLTDFPKSAKFVTPSREHRGLSRLRNELPCEWAARGGRSSGKARYLPLFADEVPRVRGAGSPKGYVRPTKGGDHR